MAWSVPAPTCRNCIIQLAWEKADVSAGKECFKVLSLYARPCFEPGPPGGGVAAAQASCRAACLGRSGWILKQLTARRSVAGSGGRNCDRHGRRRQRGGSARGAGRAPRLAVTPPVVPITVLPASGPGCEGACTFSMLALASSIGKAKSQGSRRRMLVVSSFSCSFAYWMSVFALSVELAIEQGIPAKNNSVSACDTTTCYRAWTWVMAIRAYECT